MAGKRTAPQMPGEAQADAVDTDALNTVNETPEAQADAVAGLPEEHDIDPHSISQPVLTKKGWVVPA